MTFRSPTGSSSRSTGLNIFLAGIFLHLLAASCNGSIPKEGWSSTLTNSIMAVESTVLTLNLPQHDVIAANSVDWDSEYRALEATVGEGDKAGLAAIKALHHQLDDDHDGTIEPQETGDFIKADLKVIACQGSMRSCRYI